MAFKTPKGKKWTLLHLITLAFVVIILYTFQSTFVSMYQLLAVDVSPEEHLLRRRTYAADGAPGISSSQGWSISNSRSRPKKSLNLPALSRREKIRSIHSNNNMKKDVVGDYFLVDVFVLMTWLDNLQECIRTLEAIPFSVGRIIVTMMRRSNAHQELMDSRDFEILKSMVGVELLWISPVDGSNGFVGIAEAFNAVFNLVSRKDELVFIWNPRVVVPHDVLKSFLEESRRLLLAPSSGQSSVGIHMLHELNAFCMTLQAFQRVGPFDVNLWPATGEAMDYYIRAQLLSPSIDFKFYNATTSHTECQNHQCLWPSIPSFYFENMEMHKYIQAKWGLTMILETFSSALSLLISSSLTSKRMTKSSGMLASVKLDTVYRSPFNGNTVAHPNRVEHRVCVASRLSYRTLAGDVSGDEFAQQSLEAQQRFGRCNVFGYPDMSVQTRNAIKSRLGHLLLKNSSHGVNGEDQNLQKKRHIASKVCLGVDLLTPTVTASTLEQFLKGIDIPLSSIVFVSHGSHLGPELVALSSEFESGVTVFHRTVSWLSPSQVYNTVLSKCGESGEGGSHWKWVTSVDIVYAPGEMGRFLDQLPPLSSSLTSSNAQAIASKDPGIFHFLDYQSFAISRPTLQRLGLFDEVIYPDGGEDLEYSIRAMIANVPRHHFPRPKFTRLSPKYIISTSSRRGMRGQRHRWSFPEYIFRKWGYDVGLGGYDSPVARLFLFKHPFNSKRIPFHGASCLVDQEHRSCIEANSPPRYYLGTGICFYDAGAMVLKEYPTAHEHQDSIPFDSFEMSRHPYFGIWTQRTIRLFSRASDGGSSPYPHIPVVILMLNSFKDVLTLEAGLLQVEFSCQIFVIGYVVAIESEIAKLFSKMLYSAPAAVATVGASQRLLKVELSLQEEVNIAQARNVLLKTALKQWAKVEKQPQSVIPFLWLVSSPDALFDNDTDMNHHPRGKKKKKKAVLVQSISKEALTLREENPVVAPGILVIVHNGGGGEADNIDDDGSTSFSLVLFPETIENLGLFDEAIFVPPFELVEYILRARAALAQVKIKSMVTMMLMNEKYNNIGEEGRKRKNNGLLQKITTLAAAAKRSGGGFQLPLTFRNATLAARSGPRSYIALKWGTEPFYIRGKVLIDIWPNYYFPFNLIEVAAAASYNFSVKDSIFDECVRYGREGEREFPLLPCGVCPYQFYEHQLRSPPSSGSTRGAMVTDLHLSVSSSDPTLKSSPSSSRKIETSCLQATNDQRSSGKGGLFWWFS